MVIIDDSDILAAVCHLPDPGRTYRYIRVRQDRRTYYRLTDETGRGGGSLTDAKHARETIAYWRGKGWT